MLNEFEGDTPEFAENLPEQEEYKLENLSKQELQTYLKDLDRIHKWVIGTLGPANSLYHKNPTDENRQRLYQLVHNGIALSHTEIDITQFIHNYGVPTNIKFQEIHYLLDEPHSPTKLDNSKLPIVNLLFAVNNLQRRIETIIRKLDA